MEAKKNLPKVGLALSGSGNRSPFYIGFLEGLQEQKIPIDYITASSGGSLVAAAYACGTLPQFKERILNLTGDELKKYLRKSSGSGFYNADLLEDEIRLYTKGMNFEEVRPLMGFIAADIETGEKVLLCMGDIAKAARISCTLPGIFEAEKWGGKTLVDGGLLTMVPGDFLRQADMDITVGVNMRGTRHIFTEGQMTLKRVLNLLKRILFIDDLENVLEYLFTSEDGVKDNLGMFGVIGKSLDVAIKANKAGTGEEECDIMIVPEIPKLKKNKFSPETNLFYCEQGKAYAKIYGPKILELINQRTYGK